MSKNFVYTKHAPQFPRDHLRPADPFQYFAYQLERCPRTGKHHIQGYVILTRKTRLDRVRRLLGNNPHVETRKGTHDEAASYNTKPESRIDGPWVWGTGPAQGTRSDLDEVRAKCIRGESMKDIMDAHFGTWIRYHRGIEKAVEMYRKPRETFTEAICLWGPTGTGKSHYAATTYPNAFWVPARSPGSTAWFNGYDGQDTIVFDEFSHQHVPLDTLLRLCDRNPLQLPTKGGFVNVVATRVVITTNTDPATWYPDSGGRFLAVLRRIAFRYMPTRYVPN